MRDIRKKTYYILGVTELENIISKVFHKDYQIGEGWPRNSHQMLFIESKDYGEWEIQQVTAFLQKGSYCSPVQLMLELVAREEIPEGTYLIDCW
jgi:hypothetical protein